MVSTLTTVMGYVASRVRQRLGVTAKAASLSDIFNYVQLDERTATSGQPTEAQFRLIKQSGYTTVINLAPKRSENALGNEDEILDRLGIRYLHLPVIFTAPTRADFDRFIATYEACTDERIWVHCAANMRVSAFFYKYRTERLGWTSGAAKLDLHKVWTPHTMMTAWQTFIDEA